MSNSNLPSKIVLHFGAHSRLSNDLGTRVLGLGFQPTAHKVAFSDMKAWSLPCFSINWIISGSGWFESAATGKVSVKKGDMFLRFPFEPVRYGPNRGRAWDDYWILFEGWQADRLKQAGWIHPSRPLFQREVTPELIESWQRWTEWGRERPPKVDRIAVEFQAWWLGSILPALHSPYSGEGVPAAELFRRRLESWAIRKDLDAKALANELGISYHSLRRHFKKLTGLGPAAYFIELKLKEAKRRLAATQESVSRIAEKLGFEDAYYFSRIFKKRIGVSPTDYRRSILGTGEKGAPEE